MENIKKLFLMYSLGISLCSMEDKIISGAIAASVALNINKKPEFKFEEHYNTLIIMTP